MNETERLMGAMPGDGPSAGALESRLVALEDRLRELGPDGAADERAGLELEAARALVGLGRGEQSWPLARRAFDHFLAAGQWERAVEACDCLFLAEQPGSLAALGQGIWLAVTYPVDPELTVAMLQHVVDETPADADGAAVAAAAAVYLVDLRAEGRQREDLAFFANRLLGSVARAHSGVEDQGQFEAWVQRLELDRPDRFLVRLRNVVDVLVQDDWWFDPAELQRDLPVN